MRKSWFATAVLASVFLGRVAAQPPAPGDGIVGMAQITLRVSDLDREILFLGKLGFEESFALDDAGKTMRVFVKINDRQFIEIDPQTVPTEPLGLTQIGYEAGHLDALRNFYRSIGLNATPAGKDDAGNPAFSVADPEGGAVAFAEYASGSRQALDRGQHLGLHRISTELLGVDLPVNNLAAEKQFYLQLGFEANDDNGSVRLTTPGAPDLRIELRAAHPGAQPELLLPVADARKAADAFKNAGAKPERDDGLVFVRDPDGNLFVLIETGQSRKHNLLFWKHADR